MTAAGPVRSTRSEVVTAIRRVHTQLGAVLGSLTDAQVAAPSRLPGWSCGHVLAHLAGLGSAVTRQVEHARRGEGVDLYQGGRPARDAAIEAGAPASAAHHARTLRQRMARIDVLLVGLTPADWDLPVRFRDGVVAAMVLAWWREVEIHLTDLGLGPGSDGWSEGFCDRAIEFLAERVPAGTLLVLEAPDGWVRALGAGDRRVVRGARTDLVAWLAGREPVRPLRSADDGAGLPLLSSWP